MSGFQFFKFDRSPLTASKPQESTVNENNLDYICVAKGPRKGQTCRIVRNHRDSGMCHVAFTDGEMIFLPRQSLRLKP